MPLSRFFLVMIMILQIPPFSYTCLRTSRFSICLFKGIITPHMISTADLPVTARTTTATFADDIAFIAADSDPPKKPLPNCMKT